MQSSPDDVIPQLHNAVVVSLVCREPQVLPLAPGEERAPRAEHNRVDVQDVAVDQVTTGQPGGERAAAGVEVAVGLRPQRGYDVERTVQGCTVLDALQRRREHVLWDPLPDGGELLHHLGLVGGNVGPDAGHELPVAAAVEQTTARS